MENLYTVVKCFFNKYGEIIRTYDLKLEPMTLKEAQTFKTKMTNPNDYLIVPIN